MTTRAVTLLFLAGLAGCRADDRRAGPAPAGSGDSLIAAGEALYNAERYDSARATWTGAREQAERAGDDARRARALTWLGIVAGRVGDLADARRFGEEALAIKTRLALGAELATSYYALGMVALDEGRDPDAKRLFEQARDAAGQASDTLGAVLAAGGLGLVNGYLGNLALAREGHRAQRQLARAIGERKYQAHGLANEAMVDIWEGRAAGAIAKLDSARALYRELGFATGEQNALGQLGTAYQLQGREDRALSAFDSSLAIAQRLGIASEEADLLRLIAGVHRRLGDYRTALATYERAESLMRAKGLGANLGAALRGSAETNLHLGNVPAARAKLALALALHSAADEPLERLDDLLLGAAIEARAGGRSGAAEALAQARRLANQLGTRGARIAVALADADAADRAGDAAATLRSLAAASADLEGDLGAEWVANALRARAYARLGRLDSARVAGRRAVAAIDLLRGSLASEALRSTFLADRASIYGDLVVTLLRLNRRNEAFEVADAARSRGLLEHLGAARDSAVSAALPSEIIGGEQLLARIDSLVHRLRATARGRTQERGRGPDPGREMLGELARARSEYEALMARAAQRNARSVALVGAGATSLERVQGALREDEALIEYLVAPERLVTFAVTRDTMIVTESPTSPATIVQQARLLRDLWARNDSGWVLGLAAARNLHQTLIAPSLGSAPLERVRRLVIVPHGILNQVPFAALQDAASHRFLGEDLSLIQLPSAAALPTLRPRNALEASRLVGGVGLAPFPGRAELQASGLEVEAFRASGRGRSVLLGRAATETALRASLGRPGLVHVATHGMLNARSPLFSRIDLARPVRSAASDDGRLEVHEILDLRVAADLVFLSGCETGARQEWLDDPIRGTADLSLTQALLSAGAGNVITTLWRIEDAGAARFAELFYRGLATLPLEEAFAAAQRAMAADVAYRSPYYWAGYILSGDGRNAPQPQSGGVASVSRSAGNVVSRGPSTGSRP
ncbi:MAG: CHAT domain-containing protein [Gemmatimonadales bacterium]